MDYEKILYQKVTALEEKLKYSGWFRARVTEVDIDNNEYGVIRVFIPDLMTSKDPNYDEENMGILAYPGNNALGGRNTADTDEESFYQGQVHVPPRGSWVWIIFENCNPNKAFYIGALDISNTMLPPENRNVDKPHKVYTLMKSHEGRAVIVSDSEDVQRVEITGKKRKLTGKDPAGNATSVYTIDENQTVILLDERDGKEKVLIRTHKGDYLHIDVDEQELQCYFKNDITIQTDANFNLKVAGNINIECGQNFSSKAGANTHIKSGANTYSQAGGTHNIKCGSINAQDGSYTIQQSGAAQPASPIAPKEPKGERDT